ncbi:hypothetical protein KKH13_04310 [Patescibacteria group bacterium]|nr:hypothetical protein [Patescibacteria group bacterium]
MKKGAKVFFVDGEIGSDQWSGNTPDNPKATVFGTYGAYADAVSGRGDVIVMLTNWTSTGTNSVAETLTTAQTWAKHMTHLVGACTPIPIGQRARIVSSTVGLTPLITVSASGCIFANMQFYYGAAHATSAAVCMLITGTRNYFKNCGIYGMQHTTSAGNAAGRDLVLTGGGENVFENCSIGTDTILRGDVANANLEITGGSVRNIFKECLFLGYGGAGNYFLKIGVSGIDRFVLFKNCLFHNFVYSAGGGTAMTDAFLINASTGGEVILMDSLVIGAAEYELAESGNLYGRHAYAAATTDVGVLLTY